MEEIIRKYMNRGVTITTIEESEVGRITAYQDGWVTLEYKGKEKSINCDYIVKIEEYKLPEDKHKAR